MIVKTVSKSYFINAFYDAGRGNQFSYEALKELYRYYDESSFDDPWELDVIGICCEWTESTLEEFIKDGIEIEEGQSIRDVITSELSSSTVFFELDNGSFLYMNY